MTRTELTAQTMRDMGWKPFDPDDLDIKDIVFNIQEKNDDGTYFWKLRCTMGDNTYCEVEHGMCSTYEISFKAEYLEVSVDGTNWNKVAYRYIEDGRRCLYAD